MAHQRIRKRDKEGGGSSEGRCGGSLMNKKGAIVAHQRIRRT